MAAYYQFRVAGHLDSAWSEWLGGLEIIPLETDETLLSGQITDQAALHGVLNRIRDMNLKLVCMEMKDELP